LLHFLAGCMQYYHLVEDIVNSVLISPLSYIIGVVRIEKKTACSTAVNRKHDATLPTEAGEAVTDNNDVGGNHNKYCHFCQHVKVRASSMLACENKECSRRFCEHCLLTHLGEDVNPMSSDAWQMVDGKVFSQNPVAA